MSRNQTTDSNTLQQWIVALLIVVCDWLFVLISTDNG